MVPLLFFTVIILLHQPKMRQFAYLEKAVLCLDPTWLSFWMICGRYSSYLISKTMMS